MARKRVKIVNKKRFIFSLILIVGFIFILSITVKGVINKRKIVSDKESSSFIAEESKDKLSKKLKEDEGKKDEKNPEQNLNIEDKTFIVKEEEKENKKDKNQDYKEIFKDSLFIGDSITDSLSGYEMINDRNIIAKLGLTASKAKNEIGNVEDRNFSNIYILFGMNDILTGIDTQKFVQDYIDLINIIRKKLPNANIYVQSILPVSSNVQNKKPLLTNLRIEEFNNGLIRMCKDENINYINLRPLLEGKEDLREPDGIHPKYAFYGQWLNYLVNSK